MKYVTINFRKYVTKKILCKLRYLCEISLPKLNIAQKRKIVMLDSVKYVTLKILCKVRYFGEVYVAESKHRIKT